MEYKNTDDLKDEIIYLKIERITEANEEIGYLPAYHFDICLHDDTIIGHCDLRIGHNTKTYYGGNIGYRIDKMYQGHHYATRACLLLFKLARKHNLDYLYISCEPNNIASSKTCKKAGCTYIKTEIIPEDNEMYKEGKRYVMIYRIDL